MIQRSRTPSPQILNERYFSWSIELCKERIKYAQELKEYFAGRLRIKPKQPRAKKERYAHEDVKSSLYDTFGQKCAFCESRIDAISYKQVEHFRPQSIYPLLAYSWENLFYCCERCNGIKNDRFPLLSEGYAIANNENPYIMDGSDVSELIDPCKEDPSIHIDFSREIPIPKTTKGQYSIASYGLFRDDLNEERRAKIKEIQAIIEFYRISKKEGNLEIFSRSKHLIEKFIRDDSSYAAFMRAQVANSDIASDFGL